VVVHTYDAKDPNTKFAPIESLRTPKGAPNVLVVLLDDVGFGASSAFGGPVNMPTAERLAGGGLKYTRFHTTALCSPTRQALLTGRNHHSVGMGCITEMATSAPGYSSLRPNTKAPLAEILKLNGYATAQFGKCHEVPTWQTGPTGPFDQWPTGGGGFEYFYGFLGGECNQYEPELFEGTTPVTPPRTAEEGYHLTEDLADHAINWVRQQKALIGNTKPFFMYFAPGATHAPHHVPKEWADKYKGKFDHGWDRQRELTFARQKALGVIPADAELTKRHGEIPAWNAMSDELKPVLAREMEVYAGFLEHADHQVGRLVDALEDLGVLDDTLVYYIIGDNGASAEGNLQGTFNEMVFLNGITGIETPEFLKAHIDEFGSPAAYNHYAVGWAHAMCTPYQWTKQVASHWGGTRNAAIVHWPNGIKAKGELRHQFAHVIDVAPTILEAAGLPEPEMVHGVTQSPMEGMSMRYSFDDAKGPERHDVQYFEMFGNRGIYYKGWSAVTKHRTPWVPTATGAIPFDKDVWELYDGTKDWTQAHDLAKEMPDKLTELHLMFAIEAVKYNVFPLDDRLVERIDPAVSGRPELVKGHSQLFFAGTGRLPEAAVVSIKNGSFSVTAEVDVRDKPAEGVILAQGGRFGGWSLYAKDGKATFAYNWFGLELYRTQAEEPIPAGEHQVRAEFAYDGGGVGKGGNVTLYYDGKAVGRGRVEQTQPLAFSAEETTDVGHESGSLVTTDYPARNGHFSGKIHWVQLDVGKDNFSHLIKPEDRLRVMMTRQ
jgi:arylsulfatase